MTSKPDPIDVACGARVRYYHRRQGKSQSALGEALGLTFQQIQKYERGANRISVSMLTKIANFLEVPGSELMGETSPPVSDQMVAAISTPGADRLLGAYETLKPDVRGAVVQLVEALVKK